jgi:hypothetical protein
MREKVFCKNCGSEMRAILTVPHKPGFVVAAGCPETDKLSEVLSETSLNQLRRDHETALRPIGQARADGGISPEARARCCPSCLPTGRSAPP